MINYILIEYSKNNSYIIEKYYSRTIYPIISNNLSSISNLVFFSIGEILFFMFLIFILFKSLSLIYYIYKKKYSEIVKVLSNAILLIVVINLSFNLLWGLNNYRLPLENILDISTEDITKEDLTQTYVYLIQKTNMYKEKLQEKYNIDNYSLKEIQKKAYEGYVIINKNHSIIKDENVIPKPLIISPIQTTGGYSGIYLFYIGEPTFNYELPTFKLPFVICHEIAHQKGFAREDEANYLGFLACKYNSDDLFKYSGYLAALGFVGNALYEEDKELYYKISQLISKEVKNDMIISYEFWKNNINEKFYDFINNLNDMFLKANNQPDGVKTYSKVVKLLVKDFMLDKDI